MLLTLTTTHEPATDLGFLLHKHPEHPQQVTLPFGIAHIFYPEAGPQRCTAALVLDIDPIALVRGRADSKGDGGLLDQYVNDRPYAASSFLSVAIGRVFGTALSGNCQYRPELVAQAIPLQARLTPLRLRGGLPLARMLFEPLGYTLDASSLGEDGYWDVTLTAATTLKTLLTHLYVLVPVLDDQKHYWVGEDEIDKLLRHGEDWLAQHPARDLIARRYLKHQRRLARIALEQLEVTEDAEPEGDDGDSETDTDTDAEAEAPVAPKQRLHDQRLQRVLDELLQCGAKTVLDLGCGAGKLLLKLLQKKQFTAILGVDASSRAIEIAWDRINTRAQPQARQGRITVIQGALTYRDQRLAGFDAAALVEVIEHIDPPRLSAFADAVFHAARPHVVVLTTPNADYNARYETLEAGALRHADHRFEWSRRQFRDWAEATAAQYGYEVRIEAIGEADPELGAPTQMGIFTCK